MSFQRVTAHVSVMKSDKMVEASLSLVDISETGAGFFSSQILPKGAMAELYIPEPRLLKVKGVVAWSIPVSSGIQDRKYPFRCGFQFLFENEIQRMAVIEFCHKILMNQDELMAGANKAAATVVPPAAAASTPEATTPATAEAPKLAQTVSASEVESLLGGADPAAAPSIPAEASTAPIAENTTQATATASTEANAAAAATAATPVAAATDPIAQPTEEKKAA